MAPDQILFQQHPILALAPICKALHLLLVTEWLKRRYEDWIEGPLIGVNGMGYAQVTRNPPQKHRRCLAANGCDTQASTRSDWSEAETPDQFDQVGNSPLTGPWLTLSGQFPERREE